jgi:hypothetical protein
MSHSSDEFGPSLEEMFPDLGLDSDMPDLEQLTDFAQGATFRQAPAKFTDTHLVTMFIVHDCAICHSRTRASSGYALRRIHHSRNACVEFQAILPDMYQFFDHLPKASKEYLQPAPFCFSCSLDAGFNLDADDIV